MEVHTSIVQFIFTGIDNRYTTDELLLEKMNGPGVVIDISQQASEDSNYVLSVDDVNDFEAKYG